MDEELSEPERKLIWETAQCLTDMIRDACELGNPDADVGFITGEAMFDSLTPAQQLVLVHQAVRALLCPEPNQERNLYLDVAIAAIYGHLFGLVETEILGQDDGHLDDDEDFWARRSVAQAYYSGENADVEEGFCPDVKCVETGEWEMVIDSLRDRVLPDEDWKLAEMTLDLPPDQADELKQSMGIGVDYFVHIAPDPTEQDVERACFEMLKGVPLWPLF